MEMSQAYHVRDERLSLDDEDRKKLLKSSHVHGSRTAV
jgi:hypothetical protein